MGWWEKLFAEEEKARFVVAPPVAKPQEKFKRGTKEYQEELTRQMVEATVKATREFEPRRKEYADAAIEEHRADTESYSFSCVRHGDFLTLAMSRLGSRDPSIIDPDRRTIAPVKTEVNVNLQKVTSVTLQDGKPAAREEEIRAYLSHAPDVPILRTGAHTYVTSWSSGGSEFGLPASGYHMEAAYYVGKARSGERPVWHLREASDKDSEYYGGNYYGGENRAPAGIKWPVHAEDDEVRLAGLNAVIYTPYGRGREVLDAILAEIKRGSSV